jgi:uncharacterized membrane-anchored protein YhcB (DUF1043 family)
MAIRIPIITDFNGEGLKKTFEQFKALETNSQKAAFALNKAFLPATAAVAGLAVGLVATAKAAAADQAAQAQLARQLTATTGATDKQIQANEDFISTLSMSAAVADDELRPALASLVRGTGDLAKAQDSLKTVLDVSAATGKSVQEVADAVSKAYAGNTKAIKQLSPELYQLIKDGASADEVMQSLAKTFGGSATIAANSAEGQFKKLSISLDEAKEAIGAAVLPIVNALLPALINMASWAQKNAPLIVGFATALGVFSGAVIAAKVAMVAWRAAAVITQAINYALATSFTAVQVSTGIGIATVAAGITAMAVYVAKMKGIQQELGGIQENAKFIGPPLTESARKHLEDLQKQSTATGGAIDTMKQKLEAMRKELEDQFSKALDAGTKKLEDAKKAYDDFKTSVAESVTGEFSISGAADAAKEAGTTILDQLNQQAQGAKQFGLQVEQLLRMGISETALRRVLEAGQEAGSAIANELILGGSEAITGPNGINQLLDDLNFVADTLGILAADQFYASGVKQGEAMVQGIMDAIAGAQKKLKNPNLKLADLKGIGASFSSTVSNISTTAPASPSASIAEHMAARGASNVTVNVNGGLASSAEIGKAVVNSIKEFNRTSGPADIVVGYR